MEHMLWHPVARVADVADAPVAVRLLGERLVLWRDHEGVVQAWADQCPHRGARLSLGWVATDACGQRQLVCPYHGWAFGSGGQCRSVPAQPGWTPPPTHAVPTVTTTESGGFVWVRLREPDARVPAGQAIPPELPENAAPGWRTVVCGPYSVDTSGPRLVENFLDMSHFGFVHQGYLGDADHAQVRTGTVSEGHSPDGRYGVTVTDAQAWQPKGYAQADEGVWVSYRYEVAGPYTALLHKAAEVPGGPTNAIGLFIQPEDDEHCRAWFVMATQGDDSSDETLQAFQDTVFAQDQPVVESQMPKRLPVGVQSGAGPSGVREVHGTADRVSSAYRRYLLHLGITTGVC